MTWMIHMMSWLVASWLNTMCKVAASRNKQQKGAHGVTQIFTDFFFFSNYLWIIPCIPCNTVTTQEEGQLLESWVGKKFACIMYQHPITPAGSQVQIKNFAEVSSLSWAASMDANMWRNLTTAELQVAIREVKQGKAPGHDYMHPEFVTHQSANTSAWFGLFFFTCFHKCKLLKIWCCADVIALSKPNKPCR